MIRWLHISDLHEKIKQIGIIIGKNYLKNVWR